MTRLNTGDLVKTSYGSGPFTDMKRRHFEC